MSTSEKHRLPTTLLSGYLGSGKTTLINQLLSSDHGVRVAVLVNDFGAVNIDADLIANASDQTISLTNGCVCCSISDDLGGALEAQTTRADPPDHVVIEASGVAEPSRIVNYAVGWPGVQLDSVVTVVDAETVRLRATDKFVGNLVRRQIMAADFLVLNKTDLVDDVKRDSLVHWLQGVAPGVRVVPARQGRVDSALLLGPRPDRAPESVVATGEDAAHRFATVQWQASSPVDLSAFEAVLDALPDSVHRLKGYVRERTTGSLLHIQVVGRRRTIEVTSQNAPECLVAIGTDQSDIAGVPQLLARGLAAASGT